MPRPEPIQIASKANPKLKRVKKIGAAGPRSGEILLESPKLIAEALAAGLQPTELWTTDPHLLSPLGVSDYPCYCISDGLYQSISPTRAGQPPLALFPCPSIYDLATTPLPLGGCLLLDNIQDPGNAGALVRAAVAFGLAALIFAKGGAHPFQHASIRASAGHIFKLPCFSWDPNTALPPQVPLFGADGRGNVWLEDMQWPQQFILAMGNEGHGLSEPVASSLTTRIAIRTPTPIESLNVAGAAHIMLYARARALGQIS